MKEGGGENWEKKKEKYILLCRYIILISRIGKLKLECCIVKWYCVIDKVAFWDGKIEYSRISWCECSSVTLFHCLKPHSTTTRVKLFL